MFKLLPPQVKIAIIGFLLVSVFGAGWSVNGWRLSGKITLLESNLETCQANTEALKSSIDEQNVRIDILKEKTGEKLKASENALRAAESDVLKSKAKVAELSKTRGRTCKDAEKLINEALGL